MKHKIIFQKENYLYGFFFFQEKHNMCPLKNILKEAVRAENECPQLGSSPPSHRAASAHKCPNPVVQYMRSLTKAGSIVSLRQTDTHTHTHTHTQAQIHKCCVILNKRASTINTYHFYYEDFPFYLFFFLT